MILHILRFFVSPVNLVDESSVLVENSGLKLEELDEKAVVHQNVFYRKIYPDFYRVPPEIFQGSFCPDFFFRAAAWKKSG